MRSELPVKGLMFDATVVPLLYRMDSVNEHREALQRLQDAWDHLTLLGQMSGIAADIMATGHEFKSLTGTLLNALARRLLGNTTQALQDKAQVVIDILVRNLFERTADVGFLATDAAVVAFLQNGAASDGADEARAALQARFKAYVAKYSVYDDIIVLSPSGDVLVRLDDGATATHSTHTLVQDALVPGQAFVESFGQLDVLDGRRGLVYGSAIRDAQGQALGVLCLSFKLDDEMRGIFGHLLHQDRFQILTLCDAAGQVVASSDEWQIPAGVRLGVRPQAGHHQTLCFAGREFLAVATATNGYQGYGGPGWLGCALVPLEHAFGHATDHLLRGASPQDSALKGVDVSAFFDADLQRIPVQAKRIQDGLERSVWNGELHGRRAQDRSASDSRFAAALLQHVSHTGERIRGVFEEAIGELGQSAAAAVLQEATFRSALAMEIMDRNLYERANDCRWWALDASLREALSDPNEATQGQASKVLAHINSLYTVYALLLLLDEHGRVVATSRPDAAHWVGRTIDAPWVQPTLALNDEQGHVRSSFEPTPLYDGRCSYVYAAAIQDPRGRALGGTAIVFDSAPQFSAMLGDALPAASASTSAGQAVALFVTRAGVVVSSTDPRFQPGQPAPFPMGQSSLSGLARGQSSQQLLTVEGTRFAAGITMSSGYREYNSTSDTQEADVAAVVLMPVNHSAAQDKRQGLGTFASRQLALTTSHEPRLAVASFICGGQRLGLDAEHVVEAAEHRKLTALPGSPRHMAGLVLHHGKMVPVLDLSALRGGPASPEPSDPDKTRLLLICRTRDGFGFGLLIDELAGIVDVPRSGLQALPPGLALHDPTAQAMARCGGDHGQGDMLTLLSADKIATQVHGRPSPGQGMSTAPQTAEERAKITWTTMAS